MSTITRTPLRAHRLEAFEHRMYVWKESANDDWRGMLNDEVSKQVIYLYFKADNLVAAKLHVSGQARLRQDARHDEAFVGDPLAGGLDDWQQTILFVD